MPSTPVQPTSAAPLHPKPRPRSRRRLYAAVITFARHIRCSAVINVLGHRVSRAQPESAPIMLQGVTATPVTRRAGELTRQPVCVFVTVKPCIRPSFRCIRAGR
ncbi:hypothetical protein FB451DRAFT_1309658 [Mycena latifolia]|nr:hypothetical protein FB451DRAFT_1309658 [Mycena latifolia]